MSKKEKLEMVLLAVLLAGFFASMYWQIVSYAG